MLLDPSIQQQNYVEDCEICCNPIEISSQFTINNELKGKAPISESVTKKIENEVTSSTSTNLNETTAYVDPSTQRMLDLINRVEKR